jgi:hypothetical protein
MQTYGQDWALFTDWCAATGNQEMPAAPDTVLEFLTACPAAGSTQRCRVAAIDHHHAAARVAKPGESHHVRAALGRPTENHFDAMGQMPAIEAALRALPSHGWTHGMFGRRDRCLLVLSQVAGVPYKKLATLTVGDITLIEGTATIRSTAEAWELRPAENPLLCGPCAVTRWLRALDLEVTAVSPRVLARSIRKAAPVTDRSPHLCRSTRPLSPATLDVPLLTPIDQWGYTPFPPQRLTPHSLSRRVRDLLAGDLGAHRDLPVDAEDTDTQAPAPVPAVRREVYSREDSQRAWARRRADLDDLAGLGDLLDEVDARAKDLQRRTAAILVGQTYPYPYRSDNDPRE